MLSDDLSDEEVFQAFLLYASLHGMDTDEERIRSRVADYRQRNVPDAVIDDAILAYVEDSLIAPPDVVLDCWGSSRVYELACPADQSYRHQLCEAWFQNDCRLPDAGEPQLAHFWTQFPLAPQLSSSVAQDSSHHRPGPTTASATGEKQSAASINNIPPDHHLRRGARVQFEYQPPCSIRVTHRRLGYLGDLPSTLARELSRDSQRRNRFLPLVDDQSVVAGDIAAECNCRLLVTMARSGIPLKTVVQYSAAAFRAPRKKC